MTGRFLTRWRSRPEMLLILALAIATSIALAVYKFTSEVVEGDTDAFDRHVLIAIRAATAGHGAGLDFLRMAMRDITALGNLTNLTLVVILSAGFLVSVRRTGLAIMLVGEVLAGTTLVALLKAVVARPRPDVVAHLTTFKSESFPSGHAADSAIVYLSLAILLARIVPTRAARIFVVGAAGGLTFVIGMSRLYLGVHWPSDVLAGWAIGSGWAIVIALLTQWTMARSAQAA